MYKQQISLPEARKSKRKYPKLTSWIIYFIINTAYNKYNPYRNHNIPKGNHNRQKIREISKSYTTFGA